MSSHIATFDPSIAPRLSMIAACLDRLRVEWGFFWFIVPETWRCARDLRATRDKMASHLDMLKGSIAMCERCRNPHGCELRNDVLGLARGGLDIMDRMTIMLRDATPFRYIYKSCLALSWQWQDAYDAAYLLQHPELRARIDAAIADVKDREDAADIAAVMLAQDRIERGEDTFFTPDEFSKSLGL